jgi:HK97 family phage major capsid protein
MASPGLTTTWGQEAWSDTLIEALSAESAVLRAGATRVIAPGRVIHVPRLLVDPAADWVAELTNLPSDAGNADTVVLTPKKVANLIELSRESVEDASINELDAVGRSMVRGVAKKVDERFFSNSAATATAPAGIRNYTLPGSATPNPDVAGILDAIGAITTAGGVADTVFINATDLTTLRKAVVAGGYAISDPTAPGVERVGGAQLIPAPLTAGICIVCEARYISLAVRRDASVDFSEDASFGKDAVAARVTMRVDWAPADPNAFYVIT